MVKPGWLAVYGREAQEDDANLVAVAAGELARTESIDVKALKTRPPARYTEATLLSAMEGAGKLIDDDDTARGDAGEGPRHAGDARRDHRRADLREVHPPRRARAGARRQGVPADDAAARPGRRGPDQARAHRQLGVPARRDGKGPPRARDLHGARSRRWPSASSRKAKEYDRDTIPGDYATLGDAVPELRRRGQGELPPLRLHRHRRQDRGAVRLLDQQDPGRPRVRAARGRGVPARQEDRPARGLPLQGGLAVHRRAQAGRSTTRSRTGSSSSTSAKTPSAKANRASRSTSRQQESPRARARRRRATVYEFGASYVCEHAVGANVDLRLQERQGDPAAADRARADEQAAGDRRHRPARRLRLQQDPAQVQGAPGLGRRRRGKVVVRVRAAPERRRRPERCRRDVARRRRGRRGEAGLRPSRAAQRPPGEEGAGTRLSRRRSQAKKRRPAKKAA